MISLYRISQIANKTGKTSRALRYYEELGLLTPRGRSEAGYRLYGEEAILKIEWIDKLNEIGFSLSEIREFLISFKAIDSAPDMMTSLQRLYQEKLIEIETSILRLQKLSKEIKASISYASLCQANCSPKTEVSHCKSCEQHGKESPDLIAVIAKSF